MPIDATVERPPADCSPTPPAIRSPPASRRLSTSALSRGAAVAALLVLAAALPFLPLLEGLPAAHDLPDHVAMAEGFQEGWAEGRLYPRWHGHVSFGWGEPTGMFYPPGLYFLAAFTKGIAGGSTPHGLYVALFLLSLAGAAGVYRLLRPAAGRSGALIAAFLLALAPYRAFELHGAGLLSAHAAGCLMPWLLAALWRVAVAPDGIALSVRPVAAFAASFALVTLFNLPTAVIVVHLVAVWAIVEAVARRNIRVLLRAAAGGAWGALLAAVFLLPAVAERSLVRMPDAFDATTFRSNFVFQTEGTWMEPGLVDIFSQMGFLPAALAALSGAVIVARWLMPRGSTPGLPAARDLASLDRLLASFAVLSLFLATEVSAPFWEALPFLHNIYMPWRFLDPLALVAALLGGRAAGLLIDGLYSSRRAASGRQDVPRSAGLPGRFPLRALGIAAACALAVVSILGGLLTRSVAAMNGKVEASAVPLLARTFYARTGYFVPRSAALPQVLVNLPLIEVLTPGVGVQVLEWSSGRRILKVQATAPSRLALRTYFYPGWVARSVSTGGVLPLSADPSTGRMLLDIQPGGDDVVIRFEDTPLRTCALVLSVGALVSWILALLLAGRKPPPAGKLEATLHRTAPDEAGRSAFLADDFELAYPPGIEAHYWTLARNLIIEAELRRLGLERSRILELGCGKGIVLDHLAGRGFDCRGVELANVEPLPAVRDRVLSGVDALRVPEELAAWGETLLLLDVIEHLDAPARFVREVLDVHRGIRHVLFTVPARRELWSNYDERYGHRRRYDRRSLRETISAAGLEPTETRYLFRLLYMPARALVLLGGKRSVAIRAPRAGMRPVHAALARCLLLESRMLPRWMAGTSLLCAARVPGR